MTKTTHRWEVVFAILSLASFFFMWGLITGREYLHPRPQSAMEVIKTFVVDIPTRDAKYPRQSTKIRVGRIVTSDGIITDLLPMGGDMDVPLWKIVIDGTTYIGSPE